MTYDDDQLLKLVGEERRRSIGFGEGDSGELTAARTKALAYYKGEMDDLASLPNRSKAVDTTVADAIETVLPDVIEVFVGGEDIATFVPFNEEDEDRAQEETDFVQHVVMTENEGFLTLYTAIKDALLTRTGVIHWWWEEDEKTETLAEGLPEEHAAVMAQAQPHAQMEASEDGTYSLSMTHLHGKVKVKAFPSEDFTVAPDTVSLRDATYCAVRDRPRVQELIARGLDPEQVRELPSFVDRSDQVMFERDEAGETSRTVSDATGDLRTVEVRAHYIRLLGDDGKMTVWCVVTDSMETKLLHKEEVGQIPFAVLTPYIIPHRFYGESVADKLVQVQQIQTAILRMMLDSGYFALNQRMYVDETKANEHTLADLLAMEPGRPIRGNGEGAVIPVSAGALNFDVFAAMEYVNTLAEKRSGIVRNAQGLNPDTLHETAAGVQQLVMAAQKRVRMIARIFAETGIKDLFLGVHAMLRAGFSQPGDVRMAPLQAKIGGAWKQAQPDQWPERCAMTVHVGVGSAGQGHELGVANQRLTLMQNLAAQQGGLNGPLLDAKNVYAALTDWERAAGSKKAASYWSDPANAPQPQGPPPPDPKAIEAQQKAQLQAAELQGKQQLQAAEMQHTHQLETAKAQAQLNLQREANALKLQHERDLAEMKLEMQQRQAAAELSLKQQEMQLQAALQAQHAAHTSIDGPHMGGEPG